MDIDDLILELHELVHEQAHLWELNPAAVELSGGPPASGASWSADACSTVLRSWAERGWIGLYYDREGGGVQELSDIEARNVLGDPKRWTLPEKATAKYSCLLFVAARGHGVALDEWRSEAVRALAGQEG